MIALAAAAVAADVVVGPGTYRPLYPVEGQEGVPVAAFRLDRTPVTHEEYLAFVTREPKWRRDRVSALYADADYLGEWEGPLVLGAGVEPTGPVTRVSWFAARAYCRSVGGRLPTEAEWELAASGAPDGRMSEDELNRVLAWYGRPGGERLGPVGTGAPNRFGLYDLHSLVWEWVEDFNASLVSVDNREQGGADRAAFCGAGALGAADRDDYAAFMRVAFRSALSATFTTRNLGFRCARDLEVP